MQYRAGGLQDDDLISSSSNRGQKPLPKIFVFLVFLGSCPPTHSVGCAPWVGVSVAAWLGGLGIAFVFKGRLLIHIKSGSSSSSSKTHAQAPGTSRDRAKPHYVRGQWPWVFLANQCLHTIVVEPASDDGSIDQSGYDMCPRSDGLQRPFTQTKSALGSNCLHVGP